MNRDRALDQVKAATFIGKNAAFLGFLLCGLQFKWSDDVETAGVSEKTFHWNPAWFDSLTMNERQFILLHELWHIALLHSARMGERDPRKWNIACDYRINANLVKDGYTMVEGGLFDEKYLGDEWSEENIYNDLPESESSQSWGTELTPSDNTISNVAQVQQAVMAAKTAGSDTGNINKLLEKFIRPKLPWKTLLHKFLIERLDSEWSWRRPNRRFHDVYMPSLLNDNNGLTSVAMFLDTSGSITDENLNTFISEAKFVQENLCPETLNLVLFDTEITEVYKYKKGDRIKRINVKGFGGTDYSEVHEYIMKNKPTLSIIFTDLYADPMEPVGKNKVLWVVDGSDLLPPFGDYVHVTS